MKFVAILAAVFFLSTNLIGCVIVGNDDWHDHNSDWQQKQENNKRAIALLELNANKTSIISSLGSPDFSEAYSIQENNYQILFYRTQHSHSDGVTSKDETTPLVFKNDILIGWGNDALNNLPTSPNPIL